VPLVSYTKLNFDIAKNHVFAEILKGKSVGEWEKTEKERYIAETEEGWSISLEFEYSNCGIDWEEDICSWEISTSASQLFVSRQGVIKEL
jgi:hypothetical protein